ncbi:hypothetical protein CYJ76_01935 [Kytococcus schroeteri]|uniref:YdhG-like domain-containing protein n=1 Tax=Kytococcus schroeteri TaxID=138300 RepID=A0A2I1PDC3_9MICO|nr:hypothetical protein HMPREF3099_04665 [Kytococcus sp. HMSC28H12]PKZ42648.1 hypothetical protein CYJ76_01935 [Kytococcus schroeteri]
MGSTFSVPPRLFPRGAGRDSIDAVSHPVVFDEDDPLLERVRSLCLALPEATEKIAHGRPWFSTRTGFCVYGGHHRAPGGGVGDPAPHAVMVKVDPAERAALAADKQA